MLIGAWLPHSLQRIVSGFGCALLCWVNPAPAVACTIFVLTDGTRALFFNNEDWLNPKTRIWFVPSGPHRLGCAYVGFDDGYPQGGLNTRGLAFDWVAGYAETWEPNPRMKKVHGKPAERMLETCATVDDAIAFYRLNWEPGFFRARILVADPTGASAIIGAKDGELLVERSEQSRGFGYCGLRLQKTLAEPPEATVSNGARILRGCLQRGPTATKYSNVFDLKTSEIFLFPDPERDASVHFNLGTELAKGGHYYDIPQIRRQRTESLLPLRNNMKSVFLDQVQPIPDKEPKVTRQLRAVLQAATDGNISADDYTAEMWQQLSPKQQELESEFKRLGRLISMVVVGRWNEDGHRNYRYVTTFEHAIVLQHYILDERNRIALLQSDDMQLKPGARR